MARVINNDICTSQSEREEWVQYSSRHEEWVQYSSRCTSKISRGVEPGREEYVDSSSFVVSIIVTADRMVRSVYHVVHHHHVENSPSPQASENNMSEAYTFYIYPVRTFIVSTRTGQYTLCSTCCRSSCCCNGHKHRRILCSVVYGWITMVDR